MARLIGRRAAGIMVTVAICASMLTAAAVPGNAAVSTGAAAAPPGGNLLLNPGAGAGDVSRLGWDAVTIPGWQIRQGLPTVVSYGTKGFPGATGARPPGHPGRLFAGGAGGTAVLTQQVPLRTAAGRGVPAGTGYRISAWLGGTVVSKATLEVIFLSGSGKALGGRRIGPVGGAGDASHPEFAWRQGSGTLPAGTRSAEAELILWTSQTNYNGPDAPQAGYNRAVAGGLRFSVSVPVRGRVLTPPAARVPRYQHVFLFYFENSDFHQIIGNTRQAPYMNSLLRSPACSASSTPRSTRATAITSPWPGAARSASRWTIRPRRTRCTRSAPATSPTSSAPRTRRWKGYLQSAAGPCDDTVHGYYWDDDLPMMYFADVRERPAYCAAHMVPLASLATDLQKMSTTPNFAWVGPDDCFDMESCGIRAGDDSSRTSSA